ncbi:hypothetical protein ACX0HA_15115 [Flavobacterium hauense]
MKKTILLFALFFAATIAYGQVYSDKVVGKKNAALKDSLEIADYPYILPIWGKKATEKGFQLPYSAGVSVNYFWSKSDIVIQNLKVGFNHGPMYDLDEIVRFNGAEAEASAVTIRPDVWILPFLNIYGIFGKAKASTSINAGIWVPDGNNNWSEVTSFHTKANFDAVTMGLGMTPTIGIGGGWLALDMNMAWTDIDELDKPAFSYIFGPRLGKTFKFNKPDTNIAVWVGAFRVHLKSGTNGSINLSDVINLDGAQEKVDNGLATVAQKQQSVDDWWAGLSTVDQSRPSNIAKHNTANRALESAGNLLNSIDGALSTAESSSVQYSLEKAPKDMWNFIIGTQYQFSRHVMFRAEVGFLGSRTQALGSLQYRFGL